MSFPTCFARMLPPLRFIARHPGGFSNPEAGLAAGDPAQQASSRAGRPVFPRSIWRKSARWLLMGWLFILPGQAKLVAQASNDSLFQTGIRKTTVPVRIDGVLNDDAWQGKTAISGFRQQFPFDSSKAVDQTEVMLAYDDQFLYVAATCYQRSYVVNSLRRDFPWGNSDIFILLIDPFRDKLNGFYFSVTPYGVQKEALLSNGTERNADWDQVWYTESKRYADKYTVEMAIPFKTLRYKRDAKLPNAWNINFARNNLERNERSSWAPVPRNQMITDLAFCGKLQWENQPPRPGSNIVLVPYGLAGANKDFTAQTPADTRLTAGIDAKIGVTPALNLDLTVNPDFAQVEVDRQVTNLSRFELFFPERRQFFLENADVFSSAGFNNISPFFSRRIGIGENVNSGENVQIPILFGARLSGRVNNDWRVGLMNMTTRETGDFLARNFTVASVQQKVFARSNFGFIFVNKEYFDQPADTTMFNRVFGFDYNLATSNNFWSGKLFYHRSFQPGNPEKQYAQGATIAYKRTHIQARFSQTSVGENYLAEAGYVRRSGYNFLGPEITYLFVPNGWIVSHGISLENENYFDKDYQKIEHENTISYEFEFQNMSHLELGYKDFFVELQEDFNPTRSGDQSLAAGTSYNFGGLYLNYLSTRKKMLSYNFEVVKSSYYTGNIQYIDGSIGYRIQPYINLNMNFNYTDMDLGGQFERTKFLLVGPKLDVTFTDKIFWTTFVQYNDQIDNMNINMRLQWRYQPVSDIFLVYTDNYFTGDWSSRNRALVLKITYWLN